MKRIALISIFIASAAVSGVVKPSSAETTVPMEDLALVRETSLPGEPLAEDAEALPPRLRSLRFHSSRFSTTRFQNPHRDN